MKREKVLITGGRGFLGTRLASALEETYDVVLMSTDRKTGSPSEESTRWPSVSAEMTDSTPQEEGIYDDEDRDEVERRLDGLRRLDIRQEELDGAITVEEVFRAVRRMKMGKAPGVDGVLISILRHAADAVGTNKLKEENTVV